MKCFKYFNFICCDANETHKYPKIEKIKVINAPLDLNGTYTLSDRFNNGKPQYIKNKEISMFSFNDHCRWVIYNSNANYFVSQFVICPLTKWKQNLNKLEPENIVNCKIENNFCIVDDNNVDVKPAKI